MEVYLGQVLGRNFGKYPQTYPQSCSCSFVTIPSDYGFGDSVRVLI